MVANIGTSQSSLNERRCHVSGNCDGCEPQGVTRRFSFTVLRVYGPILRHSVMSQSPANTAKTHGARGLPLQHFFDPWKSGLRVRVGIHLKARHVKITLRKLRRTVQKQVTNMAKCERKGHLPQWKIHLARRGLPLSQPGLRSLDNHSIVVAEHLTRTESETDSSHEGTRQNQQILASSFNKKRVRANATFAIDAVCVHSIDYAYL